VEMVSGEELMLAAGTALGEWSRLSFTVRTGTTMIYLTVVGALVAFAAYSYALQHLNMAVVSLYSYVNPVIAVILGVLILDEPFHTRMIVAAAVIVAGMVIVKQQESTGVKSA